MRTFLLLFCSILLYGCPVYECVQVEKGFIIDDKTNQPLEGAMIRLGTEKVISARDGFFHIGSSSCNEQLIVNKDDYKPFALERSVKREKITITIEHQSEYKDLEAPEIVNEDSDSYIVAKLVYLNSTHFEYGDTLKIFLSRADRKQCFTTWWFIGQAYPWSF